MAILELISSDGFVIELDYPFLTCEFCGDDADIHEWVSATTCDRS